MKGMHQEAIAEFKRVQDLNDDPNYYLASTGYVYAVQGKRDEALKVIDQLKAMSDKIHIAAYNFAIIYSALGDKDKAMENLEKDFAAGEATFKYAAVDPFFNNLHSDPRFADLLRRAGFPTDIAK